MVYINKNYTLYHFINFIIRFMKKILFSALLNFFAITAFAQFGMPGMGGMQGMGGMPNMMGAMPGMQNNVKDVEIESSNLPIVYIETNGHRITQNKHNAAMNITVNGKSVYNGNITIKLRGNSSMSMPQQKYKIETKNKNGKKNDVALFGMAADHDWVLLNTYTDISLLRDPLAMLLWRAMGHWAPKTQTVEVVIDGKYAGVYVFSETIKQGKGRLDISQLRPQDSVGRELSGGYILRIDKYNDDDNTFLSRQRGLSTSGFQSSNVVWTIKHPNLNNITDAQQKYIENYIHNFESAMAGPDFADPNKGYAKYIDTDNFADFIIHSEFMHNADMYVSSTYFYKNKTNANGTDGKLHAGPVWDYNFSMGNCTFGLCDRIDAFSFNGKDQGTIPTFWKKLMSDSTFVDKLKKRYTELRGNVLSTESLYEYIDNYAKQMEQPAQRHFTAYSDLLVSEEQEQPTNSRRAGMFPGMGMGMGMGGNMWASFMAYRVSSYEQEIQTLKEWISKRLDFLDRNWLIE